eukprot:CAMPEP_0201904592 /NCGR_PEP_ID=MMETSP0902-20130614/56076_1 /ASSEMBLY_ACC=CAM_ASM_000551 /TAXON_ID=420261 /ORGANISM="Thalassiosira antarctica, Strain CCMP982" /LENGTH=101 /DNA_ID=CAMNT_0048438681 /DNA_START=253 /DNA_END=558 /DNA_ORIENTATION=-
MTSNNNVTNPKPPRSAIDKPTNFYHCFRPREEDRHSSGKALTRKKERKKERQFDTMVSSKRTHPITTTEPLPTLLLQRISLASTARSEGMLEGTSGASRTA